MPASIISRMVIARVEIIGENCDIDDIGEGFCHCYMFVPKIWYAVEGQTFVASGVY